MSRLPTPDLLADRRSLRRKLTFWRGAAIGVALLAALGAGLYTARGRLAGGEQVARVQIDGLITGDADTIKLLAAVAAAPSVKGVVIAIESPGGTTAGSERVFNAIRKISAKKPVVAVVGTLAASGGYMTAIACDEIVAQESSIVGSIGVILQNPNFTKALGSLGVSVEEIKSSPLKASPNPYSETTPEARAAMQALIDDSFAWFKGLVSQRRKLSEAELAAVADGRVFTGRMGLKLKLVDQLGSTAEARAWLAQARQVPLTLPLRDWKPDQGALARLGMARSSLSRLATGALEAAGFETAAATLRASGSGGAKLDGLLSVWQGR